MLQKFAKDGLPASYPRSDLVGAGLKPAPTTDAGQAATV